MTKIAKLQNGKERRSPLFVNRYKTTTVPKK